ncbi:GNAT family N-acetyltransferase [Streptomyces sp. XM83C]|jgi:RimJ/RimL family protein N-acetyltransferase|uniref:GNAT family N-acetyltransferase n=1 Tax=Streptomyces thermocoprophilus TaxID=78356 RepID=A0ABV5VEZ4_9ACTN|nr:GNAT family N-acetyltransferase [Streptomyces sp. XM83C]MCK1822949.1 GNAT family N-acetyltransferase [Streptomyces sp. XM83C]
MHPDQWHLGDDLDEFHLRAGGFLRSRPVPHNTPLTTLEKWRNQPGAYEPGTVLFGRLEADGATEAVFYRPPSNRLTLTPLTPERADTLAAHLLDRLPEQRAPLAGVTADRETAEAFAEAWARRTGARPAVRVRMGLYRLGTLTPPDPYPKGRGRPADLDDLPQLLDWCREFAADVGEDVTVDPATWAGTRFAEKRYTFWELPDGTPVSMAGANPMVAGMVRVDPVYTPAPLRGRGYGAAVTAEVCRAAREAGATEVVLYTNAANPTSNALYRRLGFERAADWAVYDFSYDTR